MSTALVNGKLAWHEWTAPQGEGVPSTVPMGEVLLVEIEKYNGRREFRNAHFSRNPDGHCVGTVGDAFYYDRKILRFASLQDLI